jgi:hypothetical protein
LDTSQFLFAVCFVWVVAGLSVGYWSKAKMVFQSSFMLMTIQPSLFASVISVSFEVPMCDSAMPFQCLRASDPIS